MITFTKNVNAVLPYDRSKYVDFLDGDSDSTNGWYGISIQSPNDLSGKDISDISVRNNLILNESLVIRYYRKAGYRSSVDNES
jgi:hypothetical protein